VIVPQCKPVEVVSPQMLQAGGLICFKFIFEQQTITILFKYFNDYVIDNGDLMTMNG
jgi:hypothetical protein